jgi:hypothetical protein
MALPDLPVAISVVLGLELCGEQWVTVSAIEDAVIDLDALSLQPITGPIPKVDQGTQLIKW